MRRGRAALPEWLRRSGTRVALALARRLDLKRAQFEAWPSQDDEGQRRWVFARVRARPDGDWRWLNARELGIRSEVGGILPKTFRPWKPAEEAAIFDDFLQAKSLYDKPLFGECVWTNEDGSEILASWVAPARREEFHEWLAKRPSERIVCRNVPQLARLDEAPVSFVVTVRDGEVAFPDTIEWRGDAPALALAPIERKPLIETWPADFAASYQRDVETIASFERKNSADPGNEIGRVVEYLEKRYVALGLRTFRQNFNWRGIAQMNLVAVIPGSDSSAKPVLLADHIDTAFAEDEFDRSGRRVSAPGADDNGTAVAALLRAAEILPRLKLKRDVWLVHLTGEEFPGDCLGARHFVGGLLERKQDIAGLILMDMIGYRVRRGDFTFQVNAGESLDSQGLARVALGAAAAVAPDLIAVPRPRFDERSYLYNTDGVIFTDSGFPVVLLNEHINKLENLNRPHYHQLSDTPDKIDFRYATEIVKTAIETAARVGR
jgi:hypothetical protein